MKAVTLWQPWASLIAEGIKTIETRTWPTAYRGPILIHAAARVPTAEELALVDAHLSGMSIPLRALVALADLVDCLPTEQIPESDQDAFGDFSPGRHGWYLRNVRKIAPIAAKGALGIWEVDPATMEQIRVVARTG